MERKSDTKIKELDLFAKLRDDQKKAFDYFFERYYQGLCVYSVKIIGSESASKDIVQDFFVRLWEKRKDIEIGTNVKSYFIRSIHNSCMDYISHQNVKASHAQYQIHSANDDDLMEYPLLDFELKQIIDRAIESLPGKVRETFILNRFEALSYQQIADQENISVKTVEYRMGKALTHLRKSLSDYQYLLIL